MGRMRGADLSVQSSDDVTSEDTHFILYDASQNSLFFFFLFFLLLQRVDSKAILLKPHNEPLLKCDS